MQIYLQEYGAKKENVAGTLSVYASSVFTEQFLPMQISKFMQVYPEALVKIVMADAKNIDYSIDFFQKYFSDYPIFNKANALDFAQCLLNYQTENGLEPIYVLDCIQYYLTQLLKSNSANTILARKIFKDIEKVQNSKKMLDAYIKEQTVYEDLAFYFSK